MKRLHCPTCANEVFFDSLECVRSRTALVVHLGPRGELSVIDAATTTPCANRTRWGCNWPISGNGPLCASCLLVDAGSHVEDARLVPFQSAQRRALYQLTELGVAWRLDTGSRLRFSYRSKSHDATTTIGHRSGEITLDLDEADPARTEQIRSTLGEHYRTPLGHLRHELGHFVWLTLVAGVPTRLERFRELFGDEAIPYGKALEEHYRRVDDGSWREDHVSFYASAHPWEDFAESWAQLMHVHDVVETGAAWGIADATPDPSDANAWLTTSITASIAANELARAMGMRDLYPFALSPGVRRKVEYCWTLVAPLA